MRRVAGQRIRPAESSHRNGIAPRMEQGAPVAILRLAKVVSPDMPLIRGWIDALAAGQADPRLPRHDDGADAETELVSEAITALMKERARGIFQLTGPRDVTYADIGRHLAERLASMQAWWSKVAPPTPACRPAQLACTPRSIHRGCVIRMASWRLT